MLNSIIAGSIARKLADSFKPDGKVYSEIHQGKFDLWAHARACTVKGKPSGGIVLWATASGIDGMNHVRFERQKRIAKPRDLKRSIYRHAADLLEKVRQERSSPVWTLREQISMEVDRRKYDADKLPRPDQVIDDMPYEDCQFWIEWLRQQPMKEAGNEAH